MGMQLVGCCSAADAAAAGEDPGEPAVAECCNCGSTHGLRRWEHGCDYCIDCIDLLDSLGGDAEYGEGD